MKRRYILLSLLFFCCFWGCSSANNDKVGMSTIERLEAKIIEIESTLGKMSQRLVEIQSKTDSLAAMQTKLAELTDSLAKSNATNTDAYQRLLTEVMRYSELSNNQVQDYEALMDKIEDRLAKNLDDHRQNVSDFERAISSIKEDIDRTGEISSARGGVGSDYDPASGNVPEESSSSEIKGIIRKGKITGLKSEYTTY